MLLLETMLQQKLEEKEELILDNDKKRKTKEWNVLYVYDLKYNLSNV
jgi:hypothetical protein